MKTKTQFTVLAVAALTVFNFGCAATSVKPEAARILVTRQAAPSDCQFVGTVIGEQGGALTGGWTSNKNLAMGAMNDMKNQAYELGANYVVLENSNAGNTMSFGGGGGIFSGSGQQTDVTHTGNAYLCPDDVINKSVAAPQRKPKSK